MSADPLIAHAQLDEDDVARLRALHARLSPHLPAIAERFDPEVRADLIDWMSAGLLAPHDDAFGHHHRRLARHLMVTAMTAIRLAYHEHVAALYPAAEALLVVRSVDKLFDIELARMLRHDREHAIPADRFTSLQTLCAGLAHEVRNPLNAAKLQLEVLDRRLRRAIDDAKVVEPVDRVRQELLRLTELLDDFLAFARPTQLNVTEVDVVAVARQVIELEDDAAQRIGATVELEDREALVARIDAPKIQEVMHNLVRNAIEAAGVGGRVKVGVALERGTVHLRVSDTGGGIPAEIRARIYEPFFSTKEGGTGMGMAIVQNLVTMHGGSIDIATGPAGTTVDVQLPRSR